MLLLAGTQSVTLASIQPRIAALHGGVEVVPDGVVADEVTLVRGLVAQDLAHAVRLRDDLLALDVAQGACDVRR